MQNTKLFSKITNLLSGVLTDAIDNGKDCYLVDLYQVVIEYNYEDPIESEAVCAQLGTFRCLGLVCGYNNYLFENNMGEYCYADDLCNPCYVANEVLYILTREIIKNVFVPVINTNDGRYQLSKDECVKCLEVFKQAIEMDTLAALWFNACSKY